VPLLIRCSIQARVIRLAAIVGIMALPGCGGGGSQSSPTIVVPNVIGDAKSTATTTILDAGLAVGAVTTQSSATVASGDVISENPAVGARLSRFRARPGC
jgi:beta-lactam-binding protein with PASTA domain